MLLNTSVIRANALTWILATTALIILIAQSAVPVNSIDIWWHMALGRRMLETGQLIADHSIFSWTQATPYHVYNAWLSEIILYLIYEVLGPIGIISLGYLVHGGFFALATYFAIQRGVSSNPLTWVIIALGIVLSFFAILVQPELFSFAFMYLIVWLYFTIRFMGIRAWKLCYFFPIIMLLWINSHGAFIMSSVFFITVGIGELINVRFNPTKALPTALRTHLFFAFALCIPVLLVNPFGYHLPIGIFNSTLINATEISQLSNLIVGFDPTSKYNTAPYYAIDYLLLAMAVYIFLLSQNIKNKQIDWVIILIFLAYSFIYVQLMRTTHFLAPIFVFSSLDLLAHQQNSWIWPRTNLAKIIVAVSCIILISFIGGRSIRGAICQQNYDSLIAGDVIDRTVPIEEADFIHQMGTVKKLGNTYEDGSYLLYKLWPNILTIIDVRYFPFTAWSAQYFMFQSGYEVQNFLDTHQADAWLINYKHSALIHWFSQSKDWNSLFVGPAGVVFGHASSTITKPQISNNVEFTAATKVLLELFQASIVLENWSLAKRIHAQTELLAADGICAQYAELARNMLNVITGMAAFQRGDYASAASILRQNKPENFIDSTNVAIWALTLLSKHAWDANDYLTARTHAVDALSLSPKNISSVYNAAITDWQYRKLTPTIAPLIKDDITWQFLVDILLRHKEKIPATQMFIVYVFTAMHNGTLQTKPQFIVPLKLHTPLNPPLTGEKLK